MILIYLDHAWQDANRDGRRPTLAQIVAAVEYDAVRRDGQS